MDVITVLILQVLRRNLRHMHHELEAFRIPCFFENGITREMKHFLQNILPKAINMLIGYVQNVDIATDRRLIIVQMEENVRVAPIRSLYPVSMILQQELLIYRVT